MEIRIDVALVTRNRPDSLQRCLQSLRSQDRQPSEVVVSDDSNEAATVRVRSIVEEFGCRYIRGPRQGLYANRNHAAKLCRGSHVRNMDDDHFFPEDHFAQCIDAVEREPDVIWNIGEYLPDEIPGVPPHPCPGQLHPRGFSCLPADANVYWGLADGAVIFPRKVFDEGHFYYEKYPFGASYLEFGSRLHWLGFTLKHLGETFVYHNFDPLGRSFLDERLNFETRLFAMLCFSFLYQPDLTNKVSSCFEFARLGLHHPRWLQKGFRRAYRRFRKHRQNLTA